MLNVSEAGLGCEAIILYNFFFCAKIYFFFYKKCINGLSFCIILFFFLEKRTAEKIVGFFLAIKKYINIRVFIRRGEKIFCFD
ncbi:hypothetical protein DW974_02485 [Lachnospiraceae bacterium AM48-27BH]|nr:hypothetical protein DW974_02485 [Lachnospiraceae bacterium AM48-27BH]